MSARIKVAYYDHYHDLAGAEISLLGVLRLIDKAEFDPLFIYHHEGPFIEKIKALGIPLIQLSSSDILSIQRKEIFSFKTIKNISFLIKNIKEIRAVLKKNQVQILHTNTLKSNLLGGFGGWGKTIVVWHQRDILKGLIRFFYNFFAALLPNKIICISQAVLKSVDNSRCEVIYNGVPRNFGNNETKIAHSSFVVTMLGRISEWKNQEVLVRACAEVDCEVRIGGTAMFPKDNLYLKKIMDLATSKVKFLGFVNSEKEFSSADVVVHASKDPEPFGLVIAEAMASKKPVIASVVGAPKEILGEAGLYFNPTNSKELAEKINFLKNNPSICEKMGLDGHQRFLDLFTIELEAKKIQNLYRELIHAN